MVADPLRLPTAKSKVPPLSVYVPDAAPCTVACPTNAPDTDTVSLPPRDQCPSLDRVRFTLPPETSASVTGPIGVETDAGNCPAFSAKTPRSEERRVRKEC